MRHALIDFLSGFELRSTGKWFVLSSVIGVVAGLGAIVFQVMSQAVAYFAMGLAAGYYPAEAAGEHSFFGHHVGSPTLTLGMLLVVMVIGGLLSGALVYRFAPEAEGHGTDAAIESFHQKRGHIRKRIPIIKTFASAITLGTGGSGGREGPIAQIGAGFGSFLGKALNLSDRDRRIMLAAGMAGGVGAIFRAPLAGALFSAEILYKDAEFESDVIVPSAISSIMAYSVYCLSIPKEQRFLPLFGGDLQFSLSSPLELIPLALLALVLVLVGIVYIKTFYGMHEGFKKLPVPAIFRPAIGAGLACLVGIGIYYAWGEREDALAVLSTGYGAIQSAFTSGAVPIGLLLTIAIGKIITTSFTIGSGGSGGVFGPSMVIGGCLGGAFGAYLHQIWPGLVPEPGIYVIVGMAGFFAGCAHAPFSTIIMVTEMTGDYKLLIAAMWVSTICFLLCRRWTLYIKQVPSRLDSPAHRGDFIVDILENEHVSDVFRPGRPLTLIPEGTPLREVVQTIARTEQNYFPVVDADECMVGIFSARDVRSYVYDESMWQLAIARDIMVTKVVSVLPEDDLNTALRRFTTRNIDELPVMNPEERGKLLGMLRRREVIAFYNDQLAREKEQRA